MEECDFQPSNIRRFEFGQQSCLYLPDQRLQLWHGVGQADAEGDGVREAGDGAGDNGPSHGEGQHGVDHEDDEQEEGHLGNGRQKDVSRLKRTHLSKTSQI